MPVPSRALELEQHAVDRVARSLPAAFGLLREHWEAGDRDREVGLHLLFLAWYLETEPPYLTGSDGTAHATEEHHAAVALVHDAFASTIMQDAEMLFVVGVMATLAARCLGDEAAWLARGDTYLAACGRLSPDGIAPDVFDGRGYYGHYFVGHARRHAGWRSPS